MCGVLSNLLVTNFMMSRGVPLTDACVMGLSSQMFVSGITTVPRYGHFAPESVEQGINLNTMVCFGLIVGLTLFFAS